LPEKCRISGAPEATSGRGGVLEHDPEKWAPVFGPDHAQDEDAAWHK